MNTDAYVTFLIIGVLLVAIDGQLIYRTGRRYLENSYAEPEAGASMIKLVTVLFHLAVLGLLALLSTVDFGADTMMTTVVGKIGVMLLVLALAHGITMAILARIRDEQVAQTVVADRNDAARGREPVVNPVPGQRGRNPTVSPSLDKERPTQS